MHITKLGHCCLLVKVEGLTILTDPGSFSTAQDTITGIDVVLITHEHGDHLHLESLQVVVKNNPNVRVITNSAVGKLLAAQGIKFELLEGASEMAVGAVSIQACEGRHEEIFEELGQVQNTGYLIGGELYYPGDSFSYPQQPVKILALPVAGPWCKLGDAIRYALALKPTKAFPVHDALLKPEFTGFMYQMLATVLGKRGIEFEVL